MSSLTNKLNTLDLVDDVTVPKASGLVSMLDSLSLRHSPASSDASDGEATVTSDDLEGDSQLEAMIDLDGSSGSQADGIYIEPGCNAARRRIDFLLQRDHGDSAITTSGAYALTGPSLPGL